MRFDNVMTHRLCKAVPATSAGNHSLGSRMPERRSQTNGRILPSASGDSPIADQDSLTPRTELNAPLPPQESSTIPISRADP